MEIEKKVSTSDKDASGGSVKPKAGSTSEQKKGSSAELLGQPLTDALLRIVAAQIEEPPPLRTYADGIAFALVQQAINGNVRASREIADRIEGKVGERLSEHGRGQTEVIVRYEDPPKLADCGLPISQGAFSA